VALRDDVIGQLEILRGLSGGGLIENFFDHGQTFVNAAEQAQFIRDSLPPGGLFAGSTYR